jgi:integrase
MSGEKPGKPANLDTPGLIFRPRQSGWLLMWSPRSDLVERGYPSTTRRLWPSSTVSQHPPEPTLEEWEAISAWCVRYQAEMLLWTKGDTQFDPGLIFDGTVGSLIKLYQTDPDSEFQNLRYKTHLSYASKLRALDAAVGGVRVSDITFRSFKRWYDEFSTPDTPDGPERQSRAHSFLTMLRIVLAYGKLALPASRCPAVCSILSEMEFAGGTRRRTEYMTASQCRLIRAEAHRRGRRSVAQAQALAFELGVRQRDIIGEWVPVAWPGVSDIFRGGYKWLMGMRWDEIDENLILRHRLSKSVRGKKAIMQAGAGKTEEFDLKAYPMVMEELNFDHPLSGPIIVNEHTGQPWNEKQFQKVWREIARACGIPDNVQNRDSRPGAATEAELSGAPKETVQRMLGHSRGETTDIYLRGGREIRAGIARLRAENRKKTP